MWPFHGCHLWNRFCLLDAEPALVPADRLHATAVNVFPHKASPLFWVISWEGEERSQGSGTSAVIQNITGSLLWGLFWPWLLLTPRFQL